MATARDYHVLILGGLAALAAAFAIVRLASCARGPATPFRERPVPPETAEAIEGLLRELVALDADGREARLQAIIPPESPPQAISGLLAQLDSLERAAAWKLSEALGYGPTVIKAILDVADAAGSVRPVAILFERAEGRLRIIGVLP